MVLNREKLDELRRANGIASETALAKVIGINAATLWRASNGNPVSGGFIASMKLAFPHVSADVLFTAIPAERLAS